MTLHRGGQLFRAQPRTLEGLLELTQYPSRVRDGDERVAGRNVRQKRFHAEESLICPPGKSMIFHKEKIELVARPEVPKLPYNLYPI